MTYQNPILRGFHPDPSICRVGEDFYLACSSFSYFPGLPIYHSKDLVHWKHVCDAISRPEQLDLSMASASGGIWAPTIRYNEGIFYVTATFSERGNFTVSTDRLEKGFGDPVWMEMDGIDPSIFFENGKSYYCANDCGSRMKIYGTEGISLAQVDLITGKSLETPVRIWEGTGGGFLESPHIYHIGQYYYLMVAEGGTSLNHMITIARAEGLYGPYEGYEGNPILTNRNDTSKQVLCVGHGDLVEDTFGNWWMVHLGTRPSTGFLSLLGRETFLMPLTWEQGWPVVGPDRKSHLEMEGPLPEEEQVQKQPAEWLTLRKSLDEGKGWTDGKICLRASSADIRDAFGAPTMVLKRPKDFEDTLAVIGNCSNLQDGDFAGIVIYLSSQFYYRYGISGDNGICSLILERCVDDLHTREKLAEISQEDLKHISLTCKSDKDKYHFFFEKEMEELASASTRMLCCELAGKCFTGVLWGVFAYSQTDSGVLSYFELQHE